ncbi:MAG: CPBP family intramembrane metalloprotease [Alphaproteobacteria bacterium]|nr:CPBP family intramembrane metalloprotease [Alphaproteobacteria bacterium]
MLISALINALIQLAVALLIAWLPWLIFARKRSGFRQWIGLIAPTATSMVWALALCAVWQVVTIAVYFLPAFTELAAGEGTVAGTVRENGFSIETLVLIAILALIKTGLAEEIVFRGLIGKRLINAFGFWIGNTAQALVFGAIHLAIFLIPGGSEFTWTLGALVLLVPGMAGWVMGFANERLGNGSIAPGWLIHGFGNAISYPVLAFMVA